MYSSASRDEAAPAPSSPSSLGPSVVNAIDSLPCGESAVGSPHDSSQPPHKRLKGPWHDAMHADSEATMAELSASAVALLPTPPPSAMQPAIESSQEVMPELTASAVDLLPTPPSSPPLPSIMADFRDLCEDFAQREEVRPSEAEFENIVASVGDLLLSVQMDSDDDDVDNDGDSDDGGNDGAYIMRSAIDACLISKILFHVFAMLVPETNVTVTCVALRHCVLFHTHYQYTLNPCYTHFRNQTNLYMSNAHIATCFY